MSSVLLAGCMTRSRVISREDFDAITTGATASDVVACVGEPYRSFCIPGGREEYEYIERLKLGQQIVIENHYILTFREGRVIAKRFTQSRPPAYDIIYYDNPTLTTPGPGWNY